MDRYKFENLEVWQLSLAYIDICYELANRLPKREEFNLQSQLIRAAASISLNIAEGSTSQSNGHRSSDIGQETTGRRQVAESVNFELGMSDFELIGIPIAKSCLAN